MRNRRDEQTPSSQKGTTDEIDHNTGSGGIGLLCSQTTAEDLKPKDNAEAAQLFGTYEIVVGRGERILRDDLNDLTVRIDENAITTYDKDEKEVYAASYQIDASQKPWQITMTSILRPVPESRGTKAKGLIEKKGATVNLIDALPGGKMPTSFKTGKNQQLCVLKKRQTKAVDDNRLQGQKSEMGELIAFSSGCT